MEVSGQVGVPTVLIPEKEPGTHWIEDWMGHRDGLDAVTKTKTSLPLPCQKSYLGRPARSLVTTLSYTGSNNTS